MKRGEKRGQEAEVRLYTVLNRRGPDTPPWFIDIRRADELFDARGIDAFIRIRVSGKNIPVDVPVQIKSSPFRVQAHHTKHPELWLARVPLVVVNGSKTDAELRQEIFSELAVIRDAKRTFGAVIESIARERRKVPKKIIRKIRSNRRLLPYFQ